MAATELTVTFNGKPLWMEVDLAKRQLVHHVEPAPEGLQP